MRWRIPLVASLALFVTVSCDQHVTEPAADAGAVQSPQFDARPPAIQEWIDLTGDVWDVCGYDLADLTGGLHHSMREVYDESGRNHWIHIDHYNLRLVGQTTGDVWKYNDTTMRQSQWYETEDDYGPDDWMYLNEHIRIVGFGEAPSFWVNNVIRLTVNANGDEVQRHVEWKADCG